MATKVIMTNKELIEALASYRDDVLIPCMANDLEIPPEELEGLALTLSQAADALEAMSWRDDMDEFPQPKEREIVREIKGKKHSSMEFVPNWFWVQTKCGQVMQSYVMKSGRLHGMATGEMPVAWMPNPTPLPTPPENKGEIE